MDTINLLERWVSGGRGCKVGQAIIVESSEIKHAL